MSSRAQIDRPFTCFAILLKIAGWLRLCVLNSSAKHYDARVAHIYDYDASSKRIYRYDWVEASTRVHVFKNEQVRQEPRLAVTAPNSKAQQSQLRRQPKLVHQSMQPISSNNETPTLQSPDAVTKNGLMYFRARFYDTATGEFLSYDLEEYAEAMSLFRANFLPKKLDPTGKLSLLPFLVPVLVGAVIASGYVQDAQADPGNWRPLTPSEESWLEKMKQDFLKMPPGCTELPYAGNIAFAVRDCPITGIFNPGGEPDGAKGTSVTRSGGMLDPWDVYLGSNFFGKSKCAAYQTLVKECYQRAVQNDLDDTGLSDNTSNDMFEQLECCLGCCGHVIPSKWPKGEFSCCKPINWFEDCNPRPFSPSDL